MTDDMDLDALLAEAAALPLAPSATLTARILADAQAAQPRPLASVARPRQRFGLMGWLVDLADGLGGGAEVFKAVWHDVVEAKRWRVAGS